MSEADIIVDMRMATEGIKRFGKAIAKAQISVMRFFDALVDGGAESPPGYWENRLRREIAWRSLRARAGRMADRIERAIG